MMPTSAPRQAGIIALFGFTVFCSAFLLFQIQLIIAKYILPWFGGTPATFTTCILFFQMLLLFGYFYAHLVNVRLSPRSQAVVHSLLILLAITVLVFRLSSWGSALLPDSSWKPVDSGHPLFRILALLSRERCPSLFSGFNNRTIVAGMVRPHLRWRAIPPVRTLKFRVFDCSSVIPSSG